MSTKLPGVTESRVSPYFGNEKAPVERSHLRKRRDKSEQGDNGSGDRKLQKVTSGPGPLIHSGCRVGRSFFALECVDLAKRMLGSVLVRRMEDGTILKGMIVETEAYPGVTDVASHSFNGRRTARNEAMYMGEGTAYVYFTYGMYYCFNVVSNTPGSAVLIRAAQPIEGLERMLHNRLSKRKATPPTPLKPHHYCNGPSKLCIAFDIERTSFDRKNLADDENMWIEEGTPVSAGDTVVSTRVGISGAGHESVVQSLRFYVRGNTSVSKKDKNVEAGAAIRPANNK